MTQARPSDGADRAAVADGPEPDPPQPVTAELGHVLTEPDGDDLDVTGHPASVLDNRGTG